MLYLRQTQIYHPVSVSEPEKKLRLQPMSPRPATAFNRQSTGCRLCYSLRLHLRIEIRLFPKQMYDAQVICQHNVFEFPIPPRQVKVDKMLPRPVSLSTTKHSRTTIQSLTRQRRFLVKTVSKARYSTSVSYTTSGENRKTITWPDILEGNVNPTLINHSTNISNPPGTQQASATPRQVQIELDHMSRYPCEEYQSHVSIHSTSISR
ncbi:hypothetical protein BKA61DRAFT_220981 [Leptodontidium sp. MPI-SDFR-AT-0119]|nr:hypothetical protein BKA61DRAFT_220981 [Leptodontidium sp. MPI-SDFR-AT-0119]